MYSLSPSDASREDGSAGGDGADVTPTDQDGADKDDVAPTDRAGGDGTAFCVELGYFGCSASGCCEGTCTEDRCCADLGDECESDAHCCNIERHCNDGYCAERTCLETNNSDYCNYISLGCCDTRLDCGTSTDYPYYRCCGLEDAVLPSGDSLLCCGGSVDNHNGTVSCTGGG